LVAAVASWLSDLLVALVEQELDLQVAPLGLGRGELGGLLGKSSARTSGSPFLTASFSLTNTFSTPPLAVAVTEVEPRTSRRRCRSSRSVP